ncbi:UDP:flavonoid glycosyltransferase YjiC, YdhE family [Arthrobacter sp. ok909]|nr:UDP:flavonoid glycosyltransferase YjiC, YdhE family [Arthrobacter sp. ok909]
MSDFLFATLDAGGNLPPALGIGRELLRQGHRVRFLGHARQATAVEATGAEFIPYRHAAPLDLAVPAAAHRQFAAMLSAFSDAGIGRDLVAEARREPPDVVVIDCLLLGAIEAAATAGLRHVVLVHSFFAFFDGPFRHGPMGAALSLKGLPPRRVMQQAERVLVCADPVLDPAGSWDRVSWESAPDKVVWSGAVVDDVVAAGAGTPSAEQLVGVPPPSAAPSSGVSAAGTLSPGPSAAGPPRVLVSLSSTAFPGQQEVLQKILDAASGLPVELIVTTGPAVDPASLSVPGNASVHRYVDHNRIMPDCRAVICHGGHATSMRALAHGLPVMVLPMHPLMDQHMVGKAISNAGAGVLLKRTSSPDQIGAALAALLASESHLKAAVYIGNRLRRGAGARAGARILADLAG